MRLFHRGEGELTSKPYVVSRFDEMAKFRRSFDNQDYPSLGRLHKQELSLRPDDVEGRCSLRPTTQPCNTGTADASR